MPSITRNEGVSGSNPLIGFPLPSQKRENRGEAHGPRATTPPLLVGHYRWFGGLAIALAALLLAAYQPHTSRGASIDATRAVDPPAGALATTGSSVRLSARWSTRATRNTSTVGASTPTLTPHTANPRAATASHGSGTRSPSHRRGTIAYCIARAEGRAQRACIIRVVFAPVGQSRKAVAVAWCESRLDPRARNGQYRGMFQMGSRERGRFGHGASPITQARAALRYYRISGWTPWSCA
jgi:hypothetical protein